MIRDEAFQWSGEYELEMRAKHSAPVNALSKAPIFALASGSKVYTLKGDKAHFDKYAAQTVKIKGTIAGFDLTLPRSTQVSGSRTQGHHAP
jgi:hypothetical protein